MSRSDKNAKIPVRRLPGGDFCLPWSGAGVAPSRGGSFVFGLFFFVYHFHGEVEYLRVVEHHQPPVGSRFYVQPGALSGLEVRAAEIVAYRVGVQPEFFCNFSHAAVGKCIFDFAQLVESDCLGHDAVELRGTTSENVGGVYSITDCYFDNISGTAIGRSGFKDCLITISDNDFNNIAPDEDEEYKSLIVHFGDNGTTTEKQENNTISFMDNTYNGKMQTDVIENGYTADRFVIFAE